MEKLKSCPITEVYNRYKHLDELFCDCKEGSPFKHALYDLWKAIKTWNTRKGDS